MTTNILVVIDPDEDQHSALNRIKEIPPTADVRFKADLYLDAVPVLAKEAAATDLKDRISEKQAWLDELIKPLRETGYQIDSEVIVFTRLFEEIIRSAKRFAADVVFKPLRQHGTLRRAFYTSTDWNLIRLCPTPLLMVADGESLRSKPVIAAVDVGDDDAAHQTLNRAVLEQANLLAGVLQSDVHLVYAYGPAVIASRAVISDPMAYQLSRDKYDAELAAAREIASEYGVSPDNVHLREGSAEHVLTRYAKDADAGVVVIGTVARSGASGLFIGNTAEIVLERTETDMFVIKLPEFQGPVAD